MGWRWLDAWFGPEFCVVMLPELRGVISEFTPLAPWFLKCTKEIELEDGGRSVVRTNSGLPTKTVWKTALAGCRVSELLRPRWRVTIRGLSADAQLGVCSGVAYGLRSSEFGEPEFPSEGFQGTNGRGQINGYESEPKLWSHSIPCGIIHIDFLVDKAQLFARRPDVGSRWNLISSHIGDHHDYFPVVELTTVGTRATFSDYPDE